MTQAAVHEAHRTQCFLWDALHDRADARPLREVLMGYERDLRSPDPVFVWPHPPRLDDLDPSMEYVRLPAVLWLCMMADEGTRASECLSHVVGALGVAVNAVYEAANG